MLHMCHNDHILHNSSLLICNCLNLTYRHLCYQTHQPALGLAESQDHRDFHGTMPCIKHQIAAIQSHTPRMAVGPIASSWVAAPVACICNLWRLPFASLLLYVFSKLLTFCEQDLEVRLTGKLRLSWSWKDLLIAMVFGVYFTCT